MKAGVPRLGLSHRPAGRISASVPQSTWTSCLSRFDAMGLVGILVSLALLIWLSFRGWSVLLLAPAVALLAAALAGEPRLPDLTRPSWVPPAASHCPILFPYSMARCSGSSWTTAGPCRRSPIHEHQTWSPAGNPCRRACGSAGHLRRRKPFRRLSLSWRPWRGNYFGQQTSRSG